MKTNKAVLGITLIAGGSSAILAYGLYQSNIFKSWVNSLTFAEEDHNLISNPEKLASLLSTKLLSQALPKTTSVGKITKEEVYGQAKQYQTQNKCNYHFYFEKNNKKSLSDDSWTGKEKDLALQIFLKRFRGNLGLGKCVSGKDVIFTKGNQVWTVRYENK